ncbi:pyridoxal phosphate-dependent aminotransferase [Desulfopila sp. IMCC35006]|uniref:pyridoxal phosphate-dependent aminotransferase n=1 Tax=Desulfopila sp. IMCC35006 TaxID=2569542 RepID=UPI00197AE784|nr:aminotransferase class I/II-fold pyridoxal phosphate-dependent enzyme [Desulfopila sp. IMCC35006]
MSLNQKVSLNLNIRGLAQSATIAINDRSKMLQQQGRTVYRLGLGQSPFPVPVPVVEALRLHANEKDYLPATGLPALREAVAEFHRKKDGVEVGPQNVLIGPGSKELMFMLQLVYYGELIVPTPCWVSYIPQADILGRKVSLIHTRIEDRWRMTAELLERHCASERDDFRPRLLILNYPGNPEGCSYTAKELEEIAGVARKYQVLLLSDEIYGQLHHSGQHISVARYYPEGTIISSGLSKWCGAGGWRLGTFSFSPALDWLLESMAAVASETFTSVSSPIQYAAVTAFRGDIRIERYLWHARRILAALGTRCVAMLKEAGILVHPVEGAFYIFPSFAPLAEVLHGRGITTGKELCERLLVETGVAMLPGEVFGRPPSELTARLAYVDFDGAKALSASETIPLDQPLPEDFTSLWCFNVIKAMEIIINWLNSK